jgi:hypothetical protein
MSMSGAAHRSIDRTSFPDRTRYIVVNRTLSFDTESVAKPALVYGNNLSVWSYVKRNQFRYLWQVPMDNFKRDGEPCGGRPEATSRA